MTNTHPDRSFDLWRREITTFCDQIRGELDSIRDDLQTEVKTETSDETLDILEATDSEQKPKILQTKELPKRVNTEEKPADANDTDERLQNVRRQLQAMLNTTGS